MSITQDYQNELLEIFKVSSAVNKSLSLLVKSANDLGENSSIKIIDQLASLITVIEKQSLTPDNQEEVKSKLFNLMVDFQYQDLVNQTLNLVIKCINELTISEIPPGDKKTSEMQIQCLNIKLQEYKNISTFILNNAKSIQPELSPKIEKILNVI